MATITGTSRIDWSGVSLDTVEFEQELTEFSLLLDEILNEDFDVTTTPTNTRLTVRFVDFNGEPTGGRATFSGSGFLTDSWVITALSYSNASTGEVLRFTGNLDDSTSEGFLSSLTIGVPGVQVSLVGHLIIDFSNTITGGTLTQLRITRGATVVTINGDLVLGANSTISGTVTQISVLSGTNSLVMSGLSLSYDALDSVTTVNDLFAVLGNETSGNHTITYANNAGVGMAFYGSLGNDTITISGLNGDTLNGGDGSDILNGGAGSNLLDGGFGNDFMNGGAGNDTIIGGEGNDTLNGGLGADTMTGGTGEDFYVIDNLSDVVDEQGPDDTDTILINRTVDLNDVAFDGIENVVLTGTAAINATGDSNQNVLGGNRAANVLTGADGDMLIGDAGNDVYVINASVPNTVTIVEIKTGAAGGTDLVQSAVDFVLGANIENLTLMGTAFSGQGNQINNVLTGNSANNELLGMGGNDTIIGGAGNDVLNGGSGNDTIIGGEGNDRLDGGEGADRMSGGLGDDTYVRDSATDVITEGLTAGTDTVQSAVTYTLGANVEHLELTGTAVTGTGNALQNTLTGNDGNNTLTGLAGDDTLNGGNGNDTLTGGLGNDTLHGGAGNDSLIGDLGQDTVNGEAGDDQITMLVTAGNVDTIDAGGDNDTLVLSGVVGGNGLVVVNLSAVDQVVSIAGDEDRDNQVQTGFEGVNGALLGSAMTVTGSDGDNVIIGSNGADTIDGGGGNDTLLGGSGNDTLTGGTGNDVLNGGIGTDSMTGGLGDDTYVIDSLLDVFVEAENEGADTVQINRTVDLNVAPFTEIEHVVLTGVAALNATGNGDDNHLTGNSGANILIGGEGADLLRGDAGNDTYVVDSLGDTVSEEQAGAAGGTDLVQSAVDFTLGDHLENLTLTGTALVGVGNALNNVLTGNSDNNILGGSEGNDTLIGDEGNDFLNGGPGADSMSGGVGNDVYMIDDLGDRATETLAGDAGGTDHVRSTRSFTLGANLEILTLLEPTGFENLNGTGNALDNVISGADGNNVLAGLAGDDILYGFAGDDTLIGGLGHDILYGFLGDDTLIGGLGHDIIQGDEGDDRITMLVTTGDTDFIDAGDGVDLLFLSGVVGGNGLVVVDLSANDQVVLIAGEPTRDIRQQRGFEGVNGLLLGSAMTVTGSDGDNLIIGSNGNDSIDGGLGNDAMSGGLGNDTYTVDSGDDVVTELAAGGIDKVVSSIEYTLGGQVEHLELAGGADLAGTGNALANILTGNSGSNVLTGLAGNDTYVVQNDTDSIVEVLTGGIDLVQSTAANFTLGANVENLTLTGPDNINGTGNLLANSITGNSGNNLLSGEAGNDTLTGGAGNDTLDGGAGTDRMAGGLGDDTYVRDAITDVITEGLTAGTDTVQSSLNYILGANLENLELIGTAVTGTGNALQNTLTGNDGNNTLTGLAGNDTLNGGAGNDILDGGVGNDTQLGGLGNDTYRVNRGDGQDTISENDSTLGNRDTLQYGATINPLDLVISQQANDLRIALNGTTNSVTIQDWFASPATAQIETIQAGGQALLNTQVNGLIQAMAAFTTDTGLTWEEGIAQQPEQIQSILAASWQS